MTDSKDDCTNPTCTLHFPFSGCCVGGCVKHSKKLGSSPHPEHAEGSSLGELLNVVGDEIHDNKKAHDWKITTMDDWAIPDLILSVLMLITTEVAEAAEAVRNDDIENFKEELADIVIRVIGLSHGMGIDLGSEIGKKMKVNKNRPIKHGGKRV